MKKILALFAAALIAITASAQNAENTTTASGEKLDFEQPQFLVSNYFESVKAHLSPEWRKSWRPEVTGRINTMIYYGAYEFTLGIRTSPNKVFGVGAGLAKVWHDAIPATSRRFNFFLHHRHYIPLDKKRVISLYSDLMGGGSYVYKVSTGNPDAGHLPEVDVMKWYYCWEAGLSLRVWGKSNVFIGCSAGPSLGLNLGLAF